MEAHDAGNREKMRDQGEANRHPAAPLALGEHEGHLGPGQADDFAASAFARQIAEIERGLRDPVVQVGNLSAERDFSDVRDMVQAYRLVMERGQAGEVYNIGSGQAYSIQEILDKLLALTRTPIEVQIDPARHRPIDTPIMQSDNSKIQAATGWKPVYTIEQSLADILAEWRARP